MIIDFKQITKDEIKTFSKYYDYTTALGCDLNLVNAYIWRNEFNIKFGVVNNTLFKAYFDKNDEIVGYCMPAGKGAKFEISTVFDDAAQRGVTPKFLMLTTAQRVMLESAYPSKFKYVRSPENQDYIYLSKDLATLEGKKYHAKRNHISKFYKTYSDVHFETLDNSNKNDALFVALEWCRENNVNTENYEELKAIKESLENFDEFKMNGAVLYVEDKPIAMTLGSEISSIIFDVNFEKGLREYDGVYAVINNEFSKTLTTYKYINREEDMGLEGLRKSKLSYNPIIILDRFNAVPV